MSSLPRLQYHTLRHGNRQVSIELWPRPGASCLVFYPGTMFCPVQYRTFLHCLWKNGLAVAALHLTGHGSNPHRRLFSFDDLLQDGLDAERWLHGHGMGPLLLAGHSQGGILAMAHASRSQRMRACFAFSGIFPQSRRAIELTRFAPWAAQRDRLLAGLKILSTCLPRLPLPVFSYLSVKKILAGCLRLPLDRRQARTSYPLAYLYSLFSTSVASTVHCPFYLFNALDDALFTRPLIEETFAAVTAPEKHCIWLPRGGHLAILSPVVAARTAAHVGNPGNQYAGTRHNCGFAFVESLLDHARREGGQVQSQNGGKFSCELWRLRYDGLPGDWLATMPQTFMNLSGQCVQPLLAWHKIRPDQLVVVHDELDIPAGELRFKKGGGNAGHNGLKSITQLLGTPDFYRLRIGIGRPPQKGDVINWVLGRPCSEDADKIRIATDKALEVLEIFAKKGLEAAVRATRS